MDMENDIANLKDLISSELKLLHDIFGWFTEEELKETPRRITNFYLDYANKSNGSFNFTTFPVIGKSNLITIKNIEFYSLCGHHKLPFFGNVGIAYLPWDQVDGGVYGGVSKFPRAVEKFANKPQTQEVMTEELTEFLWNKLGSTIQPHPKFLFVQINNVKHLCTMMRGVKQHEPQMGTNGMRWDNDILTNEDVQSLKEEAMGELK